MAVLLFLLSSLLLALLAGDDESVVVAFRISNEALLKSISGRGNAIMAAAAGAEGWDTFDRTKSWGGWATLGRLEMQLRDRVENPWTTLSLLPRMNKRMEHETILCKLIVLAIVEFAAVAVVDRWRTLFFILDVFYFLVRLQHHTIRCRLFVVGGICNLQMDGDGQQMDEN